MTTPARLWSRTLVTAGLTGAAIAWSSAPVAVQTSAPAQVVSEYSGAQIFRTYCASCHGTYAQGDGPLAASLRRPPPNLTEIARRNKGVYPKELVFRIIDGRQRVSGHGGPDMPVWGDAFQRSSDISDAQALAARIQALVDYLETIQRRDAE